MKLSENSFIFSLRSRVSAAIGLWWSTRPLSKTLRISSFWYIIAFLYYFTSVSSLASLSSIFSVFIFFFLHRLILKHKLRSIYLFTICFVFPYRCTQVRIQVRIRIRVQHCWVIFRCLRKFSRRAQNFVFILIKTAVCVLLYRLQIRISKFNFLLNIILF